MVRWPRESIPLRAYLVHSQARADDPLLVALRSVVADVWEVGSVGGAKAKTATAASGAGSA
jgi:hypothetical protein